KQKKTTVQKTTRRKLPDSTILALLLLFFGALFALFRISWPFLGDGTVYGGMLFNFQAFGKMDSQWDAIPTLYTLYGVYYIFLKFISHNHQNVFFPFVAVSFASGLVY